MKVKDPKGRPARWALCLQQFDFDIIHRPGIANGNADALSRRPYSLPSSPLPASIEPSLSVIYEIGSSLHTLHNLQRQDKDLPEIIQYLETFHLPFQDAKALSLQLSIDSLYLDENGILCHLWTPGKRRAQTLYCFSTS